MSRPLLLAAGGTGGHVFPALAVAAELRRRGREVALVTDARGARFAGSESARRVIPAAAPRGSAIERLSALFVLGRGLLEALRVFRGLRPAAAATFGGYASVPVALAARLLRVPLLVHEQNAVMGRANRLLSRFAHRIALSFERTAACPAPPPRLVVTGNPVRPDFDPERTTAASSDRLRLLVLGGSQGARVFADLVPAAVALLPPECRRRLAIAQQCRPEDLDRVRAAYRAVDQPVELAPFFADAPARMGAADLVIARAGASTVAELLALARPSILIPYPFAADDHQTANARALAEAGAAILLPQERASPAALADVLAALLSDGAAREALARAARRLARPRAAALIADALEELAFGGGDGR
ncbi:MAG: undecaprenyldiphospho-muramoylpentapeptide beta-N-acetylglucosaminyltransferase [Geminicoccaceae bacterium]|nr:undecaprenyldiphospho-muramoylpentapeptide beta-N-acetylglucosaminyltransferase [Geminicoccaceae bacterium]MDW8341180.1 undecaprenyldiphospho-muramoylpentapeptide beta-N-acetylglucosaminyltransferase [Geminicoccaceae bacterium]